MDFILDLILTIFFEAPLEATMESRKVKTWVKTTIFVIIGVAIFALLALSGLVPWRDRQELSSTIFLEIIAFGWLVFVILGSVYGHKRKWKNND